MDAAAGNESALVGRNKLAKARSQPQRENLGKKLADDVNQADRPCSRGLRPRPVSWEEELAKLH